MSQADTLLTDADRSGPIARVPRSLRVLIEVPAVTAAAGLDVHRITRSSAHWDRRRPSRDAPKRRLRREVRIGGLRPLGPGATCLGLHLGLVEPSEPGPGLFDRRGDRARQGVDGQRPARADTSSRSAEPRRLARGRSCSRPNRRSTAPGHRHGGPRASSPAMCCPTTASRTPHMREVDEALARAYAQRETEQSAAGRSAGPALAGSRTSSLRACDRSSPARARVRRSSCSGLRSS